MDEIEVVIRLPKEVYEKIQQIDRIISGRRNGKTIEFALWNGVKNGTVLPKGHGVLKDVTNLMRGLFEEMLTDSKGKIIYTLSDVYRMIDEECPTLIKADKEVGNDD